MTVGPFAGDVTEGPGPLERDISEKLASGVTWSHTARTNPTTNYT